MEAFYFIDRAHRRYPQTTYRLILNAQARLFFGVLSLSFRLFAYLSAISFPFTSQLHCTPWPRIRLHFIATSCVLALRQSSSCLADAGLSSRAFPADYRLIRSAMKCFAQRAVEFKRSAAAAGEGLLTLSASHSVPGGANSYLFSSFSDLSSS